ncbi:hypothetical protein Pan44_02030 [Caulifigura coniformis]|uniref:Uncharacterized protein n=1 Tax=Caulifigura coniformis TaxID=2527983 RepID=A0A517S7V9_9PLAN|nr:hypothetical protein [Caulifigura coniformis]QDT52194.1 hypothetical protein Pan44_02030 [Caulifigura coniformis]
MPRPPLSTEKFPFQGSLWTADHRLKLGDVQGLFYRGLEKGDSTWRGQIRWELPPAQVLHVGETALLQRTGFDDLRMVVMSAAGQTLMFRCCTTGSPLVPSATANSEDR